MNYLKNIKFNELVTALKNQFNNTFHIRQHFGTFGRHFVLRDSYLFNKKISNLKIDSCATMPESSNQFEILPTPVKSESDKKEYRVIRLKNGLTACLISDPSLQESDDESEDGEEVEEEEEGSDENEMEESEDDDEDEADSPAQEQKMAAASLSVGVGSFSDPKTVPGMAHFLEHMVFMGSEKFPKENDFDSFISKRGGSDNASTDCETTTFYFECLDKDLFVALDKFAQFFISPLMKRGSITREREAIESEFQMALPSDTYRKEQLFASFANDSPANTFTWGNLQTLRDNISEDDLYSGVHEFRKRHYSAHRMTLAVQGRFPLDVLQEKVLECFSNVPVNNLPPDDFKNFKDVFNSPQFTKIYYIQPVNDLTEVHLTWALPSLLDKYKSKPHQYLSSILGDEGKGSLLSYLKKKVWVLGISAGNSEAGSEHNSIYSVFAINMVLTKEGLKHVDEVIEHVFGYINMMKKEGPQKRLYDEMKLIGDVAFRFAPEESAVEIVEALSESMLLYPPEDYITGSEIFFEYDAELIRMILEHLTPEKVNVIVFSKDPPKGLTFDKTEKWFGTKYTEQEIPQTWKKKWQKAVPVKEFALPPPNQFLTENFEVLEEDANHPDYPTKILHNNTVEVWYRKDQKFKLPLAYFHFYLINPMSRETPRNTVLLDFFLNLIQLSLNEDAYPARVAELSYGFKMYDDGLIFIVSGYNEKLHVLTELIGQHFLSYSNNITEDMFNAVKDRLLKGYSNFLKKPSFLARDIRLEMLLHIYSTSIDKYNATSKITFQDVKTFVQDFIKTLYVKSLVQGNVTQQHALDVVNNFVTTLKCEAIGKTIFPMIRVCQIPTGETLCVANSFNKNDSNSIVVNYYQSGPFTMRGSVIIDILELIIQEPLFDTLRTKEQLGYDVSCSSRDTFGIIGLSISVNSQATKHTTDYVESRIKEFTKQVSEILKNTSKEDFESVKKNLIKMKSCADVHLNQEVSRNWREITDGDYIFDRIKQEIAEIEKVKLDEVQKWWSAQILDDKKTRKLSVQVSGFKQEEQRQNDSNELGDKLELNLKDLDDENPEHQKRVFVKDISKFREKLYLYPVVHKADLLT